MFLLERQSLKSLYFCLVSEIWHRGVQKPLLVVEKMYIKFLAL
jgi:hypothetical protein